MLDMNTVKIGFIGYGNMSGAAAKGLMLSEAVKPAQIYACAKDYNKLAEKARVQGINACKTAAETVEASDIVFIGVKPYMIEKVMSPVKDIISDKIVVSMAAGVLNDKLQEIMPGAHTLFTAPNTPVSVCEGIFILQKENNLTEEESVFIEALLKNTGMVIWMDAEHIGLAGTIAGCSPAFTAMYLEAIGDAGCKHGLAREQAYSLGAQMLVGFGKMALASGDHPGQMKDAVCSPGGTTIAGVSALEKNGFRFAVIDAFDQIQNKVNGK